MNSTPGQLVGMLCLLQLTCWCSKARASMPCTDNWSGPHYMPCTAQHHPKAGASATPAIAGSRAFRLLFFSMGLPLELPAHLAVHTLCLALALASTPSACALPVRNRRDDGRQG